MRLFVGSLALALAALPGPVGATTYFACDCAVGADPACVAGDDGVAGTSAASPWRSYDRAQDGFAALAAGDQILFCRGGVFPVAGARRWSNGACTAASPCRVAAYAPPWGSGDEGPPRLEVVSGHGFDLGDAPPADHEEGYVLRDLELACSACAGGQWGVFLANDVDDVRLERLTIAGFSIGVHLAGSAPCSADPDCDARNSRIALRDSVVRDNFDQGWLGSGDDVVIEGNRFLANGSGSVFEHNVYWSNSQSPTSGGRIVGNELYRSAWSDTGSCQGGTFATHGHHTDLRVERNWAHEDVGAAEPGCWGLVAQVALDTAEAFVGLVLRGNRVENLGNVPLGVSACVGCTIEDNVVVHEQPFGVTAILAPTSLGGPEDDDLDGLVVRNNSVYVLGAGTAIRVGAEGDGHLVVSNAIHFGGAAGARDCFDLGLPPAAYDDVDHNRCAADAGPAPEWEAGSGTLAAWQGATGFDGASLAVLPGFAAPASPARDLTAASPAASMVGAGHPASSSPTEIHGSARGTPPDAGAHQLGHGPDLFRDGFETADTSRWSSVTSLAGRTGGHEPLVHVPFSVSPGERSRAL